MRYLLRTCWSAIKRPIQLYTQKTPQHSNAIVSSLQKRQNPHSPLYLTRSWQPPTNITLPLQHVQRTLLFPVSWPHTHRSAKSKNPNSIEHGNDDPENPGQVNEGPSKG